MIFITAECKSFLLQETSRSLMFDQIIKFDRLYSIVILLLLHYGAVSKILMFS